MDLGEQEAKAAMRQVADWARAWVENETCIQETPRKELRDEEKAALVLINLILKTR